MRWFKCENAYVEYDIMDVGTSRWITQRSQVFDSHKEAKRAAKHYAKYANLCNVTVWGVVYRP